MYHICCDTGIPLNFIAIAVSWRPSFGRCALEAHSQTCNWCGTASRMMVEVKYFLLTCVFSRLYWWCTSSFSLFVFRDILQYFLWTSLLQMPWLPSIATWFFFHFQQHAFTPLIIKNTSAIVKAAMWLHQAVVQNFLLPAIKFHFLFNVRDLSCVFQIYIMGCFSR